MIEIINLNKARKAKRKQMQTETAKKNRVIHGVPGRAKKTEMETQKRLLAQWEGKRLNTPSQINGVDEKQ